MPRLARLLGLLLTGTVSASLALVAFQAAPAAASSGSVSAPNGVLYDTCADHPYRYSFSVDPGYDYDLSISVEVFGPDGTSSGSDYDFDISTSGTGGVLFCGYEMAGRYQVEAEVEACDYDYNCYSFDLRSTSFTMRKPKTRTTLTVTPRNPRFNQVTTFKIGTRDERPAGYFPTDGTKVALEVRVRDGWARVKKSTTYAWNGKASVKYRWDVRKPLTLRAITLRSDSGSESTSRAVTIR